MAHLLQRDRATTVLRCGPNTMHDEAYADKTILSGKDGRGTVLAMGHVIGYANRVRVKRKGYS